MDSAGLVLIDRVLKINLLIASEWRTSAVARAADYERAAFFIRHKLGGRTDGRVFHLTPPPIA